MLVHRFVCFGVVAVASSFAAARQQPLAALVADSGLYEPIGANVALIKLELPTQPGLAVFAFPSALGQSGLFGTFLDFSTPELQPPFPIPGTPPVAVGGLISTNAAGFVAYRSQIQFQSESSIVVVGPVRGPQNLGAIRVFPAPALLEVTDPVVALDGQVFFGARDSNDFIPKIYTIENASTEPRVYISPFTFLDTILSVAFDSSCRQTDSGQSCTLAALVRREIGPTFVNFVRAEDLFLDIAPVTTGPLARTVSSLDASNGEISVVDNAPGGSSVLTVIREYQLVDPPAATFTARQGFAINRAQNFCGVRALPHYPNDNAPDPVVGPTAGASFIEAQACPRNTTFTTRAAVGAPLLGSTIVSIATNPRAIDNRGAVVFSALLADGRSGLFFFPPLRTSCPGDSNCDLRVDFGDITATLEQWGTTVLSESFCVPLGDSNFDRTVFFSDLTTTLERWRDDCR